MVELKWVMMRKHETSLKLFKIYFRIDLLRPTFKISDVHQPNPIE